MFPIRVKTVQESDLRMLGSLARNIQRVLPVTQADIDAAAALGKGWVVWKVFEVSDPLDNMRGGTQLIIRQNSVQPGQNVRRVIFVSGPGGQTVVIRGADYIVLPDAIANSLSYVKAFGGTEQRNVPEGYVENEFVYMMDDSYLLTNIIPEYGYRIEMDMKTTTTKATPVTYLGASVGSDGIRFAHVSNKKYRVIAFGDTTDSEGTISNNARIKYILTPERVTIYEDGVQELDYAYTATTTGTSIPLAINAYNYNETITAPGEEGIYLYSLKIWNTQGELVMDLVPATKLNPLTVGFYDKVSGQHLTATAGTFAAGPAVQVPTPDAPIEIVGNNGVLKVRHQSGLPLGYQMVEWLKSTGVITITGFKTKSTQEITTVFYREQSGAAYLYVSDSNSSGTTNTTAYLTSGAGNWRWDGKSTSISVSTDIKFTSIQKNGGVWLNGTKYGGYTNAGDFVSTADLRLLSNDDATIRFYSLTVNEGETVTLDLVPVQRLSDGAYGFYDKVSGEFYTNSRATFVAGEVIDDPVEIYTDGTVETINAHGKNLLDADVNSTAITATPTTPIEIDFGLWYKGLAYNGYANTTNISNFSSGIGTITFTGLINNSYGCVRFVKLRPNTTYAISCSNPTSDHKCAISCYVDNGDGTYTPTTQIKTPAALPFNFTTNSNVVYGIILYSPGNTSITYSDIQLEQGSTATDYEPYFDGGTATAQRLLKLGDYADEQEILSGVVTRNVGVKVLDGTEDWTASTTSGVTRFSIRTIPYASDVTVMFCNILPYDGNKAAADTADGTFNTGSSYVRFAPGNGITTSARWKQFLADQYAAGTPVIVIYPLETPTTESVAGQALQVQDGDNVLEITQAGMDGLELEAQYNAAVSLTIQEVQDANLDNNVTVTIQ